MSASDAATTSGSGSGSGPEPTTPPRRRLIGLSTKMYFSSSRTISHLSSLLSLLSSPSAPPSLSHVDIFLIPDYITLSACVSLVQSSPSPLSRSVIIGAQDCHWEDHGPWTGEISPAVLKEVGCGLVELGHAERRRHFKEEDGMVADKARGVVRNGMVPLVCVGEREKRGIEEAVEEVMGQVRGVLEAVGEKAEVVLAYEPVWAIGASEPAGVEWVGEVVRQVRGSKEVQGRKGEVRIVYGGSAGPGLWERLKGEVDGLFLGRFGHEVEMCYKAILEVAGDV